MVCQYGGARFADVVTDATVSVCRYELQIQRPIKSAVTGDLVEMMLIQIQFIKRELMSAMQAMDEILRENRVRNGILCEVLCHIGHERLANLE